MEILEKIHHVFNSSILSRTVRKISITNMFVVQYLLSSLHTTLLENNFIQHDDNININVKGFTPINEDILYHIYLCLILSRRFNLEKKRKQQQLQANETALIQRIGAMIQKYQKQVKQFISNKRILTQLYNRMKNRQDEELQKSRKTATEIIKKRQKENASVLLKSIDTCDLSIDKYKGEDIRETNRLNDEWKNDGGGYNFDQHNTNKIRIFQEHNIDHTDKTKDLVILLRMLEQGTDTDIQEITQKENEYRYLLKLITYCEYIENKNNIQEIIKNQTNNTKSNK